MNGLIASNGGFVFFGKDHPGIGESANGAADRATGRSAIEAANRRPGAR